MYLKYEEGIDTREALEIASESIVDGRISGDSVEVRDEDVYIKKDMGKYEVLAPQDINPERWLLEVDLHGRRAIGIEVRRRGV